MTTFANWKDVFVRALKTFVETALSFLIAALSGIDFTGDHTTTFWVGIALSAGAAGLSAVWNGVIQPIFTALPEKTEPPDIDE